MQPLDKWEFLAEAFSQNTQEQIPDAETTSAERMKTEKRLFLYKL